MANAQLLPNGEQVFLDANGDPLASGKVYFYEPSTTTDKTVWSDAAKTTPLAQPVVLDAAGRAVIYGAGVYRQVLQDSASNEIWDRETAAVSQDVYAGMLLWAGTSTGTANSQTLTLADQELTEDESGDPIGGQAIAFVAGATNTGALQVTVSWDEGGDSNGPIDVVKRGPDGPVALEGGEIIVGNLYVIIYDDASGTFMLLAHSQTIGLSFSIFAPVDDQELLVPLDDGEVYLIPSGAAGSRGYGGTPNDSGGNLDVDLQKNGSSIGTIRFPDSTNAATFVSVSETSFVGGDRIGIVFPGTVEASNLAVVGITLKLRRSG